MHRPEGSSAAQPAGLTAGATPAAQAMAPAGSTLTASLSVSAAAVGPSCQQLPDEVLVRILGCLNQKDRCGSWSNAWGSDMRCHD